MRTFFSRIQKITLLCLSAVMIITATPVTTQAASYPAAYKTPTLTGNKQKDVVAIAKSQIGYTCTTPNYTAYTAEVGGMQGASWCGYFVKWVMNKAKVTNYMTSDYGSTTSILQWFEKSGKWHGRFTANWSYNGKSGDNKKDLSYVPRPGDVVMMERNNNRADGPDHTALVVAVTDTTITTVEGNFIGNCVNTTTYSKTNTIIWGYGNLGLICLSGCSWGTGVVTRTANCGYTGITTYTCSKCGNIKKVTSPKVGNHEYVHNICQVCKLYQTLDAPVLGTPQNITAGVKITWGAVKDAEMYKVYRKLPGGNWTALGKTSDTSFVDETALNGIKYIYTVRCLSADGKRKISSYDAEGKTQVFLSRLLMRTPINEAGLKMRAWWNRNMEATGYVIQYSTDASFKTGVVKVSVRDGMASSRIISGLTKGRTYYVRARAYKTVDGKNYFSKYGSVKAVTINN